LFELARAIWSPPERAPAATHGLDAELELSSGTNVFPANGSTCRFTYWVFRSHVTGHSGRS
jgi:hypothetical protein